MNTAQTAWIGLGANLGDARQTLARARRAIAVIGGTRITGQSSDYRSEPVDAPGQPDYWNAVLRLSSALSAQDLLIALQNIEIHEGRVRSERNAARTLDLDLLLFGTLRLNSPTLVLPHPRMHLRAFVLQPMLEIDAAIAIPGLGPVNALLPALASQRIERVA